MTPQCQQEGYVLNENQDDCVPEETPTPTPPMYEVGPSCSEGTTRNLSVLMTSGLMMWMVLCPGNKRTGIYLFTASGTFTASSNTAYKADAGYTTTNSWAGTLRIMVFTVQLRIWELIRFLAIWVVGLGLLIGETIMHPILILSLTHQLQMIPNF